MTELKIDNTEEMHMQFCTDLCDAIEKSHELGVSHQVYVAIQLFTQLALDFAPDENEAYGAIMSAIKNTEKEQI
jgi:hypothetical protein